MPWTRGIDDQTGRNGLTVELWRNGEKLTEDEGGEEKKEEEEEEAEEEKKKKTRTGIHGAGR